MHTDLCHSCKIKVPRCLFSLHVSSYLPSFSLFICGWLCDAHWLSFPPPSLHHGESSLLIICPEQQELIIEASQTCFCVCNFCQMCRKGCVCVLISILRSWKLSVYFIVLGSSNIQSAFMHIKHFYYTIIQSVTTENSHLCLTHFVNMLTPNSVLEFSLAIHYSYCFLRLFNNYLVC